MAATCLVRINSCYLDILEDDSSSSLILKGQQLLGVLPLLLTVLLEQVGEARQSHVVAAEVMSLLNKQVVQLLKHLAPHYYLAKKQLWPSRVE